jgi:hypothetical protein
MAVIVWQLDLQLTMQSVLITTQDEEYNIVIEFISDLRQVSGFLHQ